MGRDGYLEIIEDQGHKLVYNPPGNGNCQFAALAYHLSSLGILRSPETMREEIVKYLETHPLDEDGFSLYEWVPHFDSWSKYLTHMAQDHTYNDQLTLYAAANLYNVNIHTIASLGADASHVFHPGLNVPATTLFIGHFAEKHYIALNGLTQEENIVVDVPVENVANHEENNHTKCHTNDENRKEGEDDDGLMEYEQNNNVGDDQRETEEEGEEEDEEEEDEVNDDCDYDDNGGSDANVGPTSQLPNEILDKIIDFALTGTDISIIITYNSLCQLCEPFKELTMRYICRLPRISYNHRDSARNGCFSLRKLCKEFGPYSGLVMALKEIIASPCCLLGLELGFMLLMYGGKYEGAIKVHLLARI